MTDSQERPHQKAFLLYLTIQNAGLRVQSKHMVRVASDALSAELWVELALTVLWLRLVDQLHQLSEALAV
jgi:hypothetical protein